MKSKNVHVDIPSDAYSKMLVKVEEIKNKLELRGFPKLEFELKLDVVEARVAGYARGSSLVVINKYYVRDHFEEVMNTVLAHEICHIYQDVYFPRAKQDHGPEWKSLMLHVGLRPVRCHSMEIPELQSGRKKKTRYIYSNGVKEIELTKAKHVKIMSGRSRFTLAGLDLVYTGKTKVFY